MPKKECPILYIVIPCYNEEEVLPVTGKLFLNKITQTSHLNKCLCTLKIQ